MHRDFGTGAIKIDQLLQGRLGTYRVSRRLHPRIWAAVPSNPSTGPIIIKTAPKPRLDNERTVLGYFRSQPYVRQLVDEIHESDANPPALVLKRLDDNLHEAANTKRLKKAEAKLVARDVLEGLRAFHEAGWVHTDIKPDNILVNYGKGLERFSAVQLGDCVDACRANPDANRNRHTIGVALYRSPEAMLNLPWDTSTDIWSFGVTITTLLQNPGRPHIFEPTFAISPSDETYPFHVLIKQVKQFGPFPPRYSTDPTDGERLGIMNYIQKHILRMNAWEGQSSFDVEDSGSESESELTIEDQEFICRILKMDPTQRPTARELLKDNWFG